MAHRGMDKGRVEGRGTAGTGLDRGLEEVMEVAR